MPCILMNRFSSVKITHVDLRAQSPSDFMTNLRYIVCRDCSPCRIFLPSSPRRLSKKLLPYRPKVTVASRILHFCIQLFPSLITNSFTIGHDPTLLCVWWVALLTPLWIVKNTLKEKIITTQYHFLICPPFDKIRRNFQQTRHTIIIV